MNTDESIINPELITKPIQLLAAWLIGLLLTNSTFLYTACNIGTGTWIQNALVIAAIANVPIFLCALFLLQTKFRPELQDDHYYSKYITTKSGERLNLHIPSVEAHPKVVSDFSVIDKMIDYETKDKSGFDFFKYSVGLNDYHPKFLEIKKALEENGIPITRIFGTANTEKKPSKWIISIRNDLSEESIIALLNALLPFSNEFSGFILSEREEYDEDDIYIGSYVEQGRLFPLNEPVVRMIKKYYRGRS